MIKNFLIFVFLGFPLVLYGNHIPEKSGEFKHLGSDLRVWKKNNKLRYLLEFQYRSQEGQADFKNLRLGAKYRLSKHIKTGLYFKRSYGLRHDDDWVKEGSKWLWIDSTERAENIFQLELQYANLLPLKASISYQLNFKYEYNMFNDHQNLKVRPGLVYFLSSKWMIFLRYEVYLPLNFSEESIYEKWAYLGVFYKYSSHFKFGPYISKGQEVWTKSKEFKETDPEEEYTATHSITRLALAFNFYF